ncbi:MULTISPECIES: hypothetical protein [unclassified Streptomyces]|uniref:hypothetical protein n=1 Tax=unclassified Streptomyces TaxID=2593676 RepID=UPI00224EA55F|nr:MULTISPECIES: hypothetical protein [unclassified Streptomyces]MCX5046860.1 hypothetical protein [Streptomyces sp. NBC_00474]
METFVADGGLPGEDAPDDCHGVAWSLPHQIETGPNPVLTVRPGPAAGEWQHRLWQRCVNAGLVAGEPAD